MAVTHLTTEQRALIVKAVTDELVEYFNGIDCPTVYEAEARLLAQSALERLDQASTVYASGGFVPAGKAYIVGETASESILFNRPPRLTPEARDNIGTQATALQEYTAKAQQDALKAEAEQATACAIQRSMAFR